MHVSKTYTTVCFIVCCFCIITSALGYHTKPSLELSFNDSLTTPLLHPPYISGTIGDPTDPAATLGFYINVKDGKMPLPISAYEVVADVKESLLDKTAIQLIKKDGAVCVKIMASKPGISSFNIQVLYKGNTQSIEVNYAASLATGKGGLWQTGMSDASAAVNAGHNCMLVADDELNTLNLYNYTRSGLPVTSYNYADFLNLQDKKDGEYREIDCEATARSLRQQKVVYWLGSMSNGGKDFDEKVNRSSLFSTRINDSGYNIKLSFSNNYQSLRKDLIKWGNAHGYKLSAAAQDGQPPKEINGFNVEGACFAPDSSTLYIGFRAPIVPADIRTKALIAPVQDFENWFNNGKPDKSVSIGEPIELNLGGRGIRDIVALPNKKYLIIAGGSDTAKITALYLWSGQKADAPVELNTIRIADVPVEGVFPITTNGVFKNEVVLITDSGALDYYQAGNANKNLHPNFRKFMSLVIKLPETH